MDSVANRYAIALLYVAREENKIRKYINEVESIIQILDDNEELGRILKDYGLTIDEKKETIDLCFKGKINEYILNLFYVIIDNKRGAIFKQILEEFVRIGYKDLNIKNGTVYSTIKLTDEEIKSIEKRASSILNSTVILKNKIDDKLLGGFKIQVDDFVIDESIQKRLSDLKISLLKKEGKE